MNDKPALFKLSKQKPLYQMVVALLVIVGVGMTLSFILIMAGKLVSGNDLSVLSGSTTALSPKDVAFLRYLLIIQDVSLLLIPSIIILVMMQPEPHSGIPELRIPKLNEILLVVILTLCLIPVTSFTGEINLGMHLPYWLSGVEQWMEQKEETADNLIESLADSHTWKLMLLNLFSIALIPAIAEEFIFRGVFQNIFIKLFRSPHTAIWVTAFIFSAIHFQFFGFIPRFILGLTFGYLYFWSGTLWLPVTAHFVNNAFPVIIAFQHGLQSMNTPSGIPLWKQAIAMPVPVIIIMVILSWFRDRRRRSVITV